MTTLKHILQWAVPIVAVTAFVFSWFKWPGIRGDLKFHAQMLGILIAVFLGIFLLIWLYGH